jgi:hypothetical protein
MDLPIMAAAAAGITLVTSLAPERASLPPDGTDALVGAHLYASETHIPRWGEPVRAEDVTLEDLGRVAAVIEGADGIEHLVVEVGGLWGWGAQDVEVGMERLHLLRAEGGERLVVDLSAAGALPAEI